MIGNKQYLGDGVNEFSVSFAAGSEVAKKP